MRYLIRIIFLLFIVFCFSCEKLGTIVKCSECTTDEPLSVNLDIKLDPSVYGVSTVINIYEGNLDDSILYKTLRTSSTQVNASVTINKKYTITAEYWIPDSYYIAVDSATPRVVYEKEQCDNPCYYVYDKKIDLRLKYTK